MSLLKKEDILRGLKTIDDSAKAAGISVDLSIYGGAALALAFNIRHATRDVDAVVHGSPAFLRKITVEIATNEGWPEDWLNDGVKGFTSSREKMLLMKDFVGSASGGLRIFTPAPEYIFAMKCMAMRPEGIGGSHDISDIDALADEANIESADAALMLVEAFYPASIIPQKVRFGVEEIMHRVLTRRAEESQERARRILEIPNLMNSAGAPYSFWKNADSAIKKVDGDVSKVDWLVVEDASVREWIGLHGQRPAQIAEALQKYSPGTVSEKQQRALNALIANITPEFEGKYSRAIRQSQHNDCQRPESQDGIEP